MKRPLLLLFAALLSCSPPAIRTNFSADFLNQLAEPPPVPSAGFTAIPFNNSTPSTAATTTTSTPDEGGNHRPELVRRALPETVIAGREVFFGLDVADEEFDNIRIELPTAPAGATLDERTLTVQWRVPRNMTGAQRFVARITENPDASGEAARTTEREFTINVAARGPVAGTAETVPTLAAQLVTITNEAYLRDVARTWPLPRVLEFLQRNAVLSLSPVQQARVHTQTGAQLFNELLTHYATLHNYPRMNPSARDFDRRFAANRWRLVAVRPRVNKHIEELRLAYQATDVPMPVFAMVRVRLFPGPWPSSPELVRANNVAFTRLVHQAFFDGTNLRPGISEGTPDAMRTAVRTFVDSVMNFQDARQPNLRPSLVAIPEEARLGGGSTFDTQGHYQLGNAWAFTVANMRPVDAGGGNETMRIVNVPISSFTFDLAPASNGAEFTSVCTPRYRDGGEGNEAGLSALCERDGTVRIRDRNAEEAWVATRRDSMTEHRSITMDEMLQRIPLRDPRRRNFEESGITCVQCHVRNFDDGVLSERQVEDPRVSAPITPARELARVAFQVLPVAGVTRSPWFVQQETFQVCDLGRRIREQLAIRVSLPCPEGY